MHRLLVVLVAALAACAPRADDPPDAGAPVEDAGEVDDDAGAPALHPERRGVVEACVDTRAPAPERTDFFTDATGSTWVALGRTTDFDSIGTSGTHVWFGDALAVSSDALDVCVIDRAAITYTLSHHNFQDTAEVAVDAQTVKVQFDLQDYDDLTPQLLLFVDGVQTEVLAPVP